MVASFIKALSACLLFLGGIAYAGFLVFLGARLHELEMRLDELEEEMEVRHG